MTLSGYQILFIVLIALLIGVGATYYVKGHLDALKEIHALDDQKNADSASCEQDKQLTKGITDDLQNHIDDLNVQLASVVQQAPAVVPIAHAPIKRNATTKPAGHVQADGIAAVALYDYAVEAEHYRLQLSSCQEFITKTWKAKGQAR